MFGYVGFSDKAVKILRERRLVVEFEAEEHGRKGKRNKNISGTHVRE